MPREWLPTYRRMLWNCILWFIGPWELWKWLGYLPFLFLSKHECDLEWRVTWYKFHVSRWYSGVVESDTTANRKGTFVRYTYLMDVKCSLNGWYNHNDIWNMHLRYFHLVSYGCNYKPIFDRYIWYDRWNNRIYLPTRYSYRLLRNGRCFKWWYYLIIQKSRSSSSHFRSDISD